MHPTPRSIPVARRFLTALICVAGFAGVTAQAQVVTQDKPFVPRLARDSSGPDIIDMARCKSDYPRASRLAEEQGVAVVGVTVAANGETSDIRIQRSSGFKNLDRATINGLRNCLFRPLSIDGKTYRGAMSIAYEWRLEN